MPTPVQLLRSTKHARTRQELEGEKPTGAGDDDVHLSDDLVEFHQPEAVHAAVGWNKKKAYKIDPAPTA